MPTGRRRRGTPYPRSPDAQPCGDELAAAGAAAALPAWAGAALLAVAGTTLDAVAGAALAVAAGAMTVEAAAGKAAVPPVAGAEAAGTGVELAPAAAAETLGDGAVPTDVADTGAVVALSAGCDAWAAGAGGGVSSTRVSVIQCW